MFPFILKLRSQNSDFSFILKLRSCSRRRTRLRSWSSKQNWLTSTQDWIPVRSVRRWMKADSFRSVLLDLCDLHIMVAVDESNLRAILDFKTEIYRFSRLAFLKTSSKEKLFFQMQILFGEKIDFSLQKILIHNISI